MESTRRYELCIDAGVDEVSLLEGLDTHFRAEGARPFEAKRGDFCGEHHSQAEHFLLVALEGAVIQGLVVLL